MDKDFVIKVDGASYRSTKVSRTNGGNDSLYHVTEESPFFTFSEAVDIVVMHFQIPPPVPWKVEQKINKITIHWSPTTTTTTTSLSSTHPVENYGAGQIRLPSTLVIPNKKDAVVCSLSFETGASVKTFEKNIIPIWKSSLPNDVKAGGASEGNANKGHLDCFSETINRMPSKIEFVSIKDFVKEIIFSVNYFDFSRVLTDSKKIVF